MKKLILSTLLIFAFPVVAQSNGLEKGVTLYLNTQQAFSEAAVCHVGSVVVGRATEARTKGLTRAQFEASFDRKIPAAMAEMIDAGFAYPEPSLRNAEDYYAKCAESAAERMNEANKKAAFSGS